MTTYYISPSGSDSNAGTSTGLPWQTITKVNGTSLNPGDSVLFQAGGTWSGTKLSLTSAGTALNPITIGSYGTGANPIITSGTTDAILLYNVGAYAFQNLTLTGISGSTAYNGFDIFASGTATLPAITFTNCSASGWKYGLIIGGANIADGWNGITVTGCDFSGNVFAGILTYSNGTFSTSSPAYSHSNVVVQNTTADNNTGLASYTTNWSGSGIVLGNVNGGTVTGCTSHDCGASNGASNGPAGIWTYQSNNVVIKNCVAYNIKTGTTGDGDGFDIDIDCTNCTIEYCIAYGNAGAGILAWGGTADTFWGTSGGNVIRWNVCWGNGTNGASNSNFYGEITLGGNLAGLEVYNNTCVARTTGSAQPPAFTVPTANTLSGITVRNNIFYCASTDDAIVAASAFTTGQLLFQGSDYYSTGTFGIYWGGTTYASLAAWQAATGQEELSGSPVGQQANPQLASVATTPAVTAPGSLAPAYGLQLAAGSPCIGAGLNLQSLFSINPGTADFFGGTLGATLPAGAHFWVPPYVPGLLPVLPQIIVEAGLVPDAPAGQASTALRLDDVTFGKLDTATLGTSITWTDISQWVIGFTITRPSTRLQGPLWQYQAGTVSITLDNSDGRFDPDNLAGPYVSAGITQLTAMVPVRIRSVFASVTDPLYGGFADGWIPADVTYEGGYAEITLPGTDAFKILAGIVLPTVATEGIGVGTGSRINDILNRAGWYTSAEWRAVGAGASAMQGTTLGDYALSLMQIAVDSEIGQLYVSAGGAVTFRGRHQILTDTRSNTVQAVFGDLPGTSHTAGVELACAVIGRASDDTTIGNDIQATRVGGSLQEVQDAASIATYLFPRTYARTDLILQADSDALNWAEWVLYISRGGEDRFESLQIDPAADPYNLWPQVLGREIGDRIQIWHRPASVATPVTKDCFIAGITHAWDSIQSTWLTTWTLQDAAKYGSFMTLDNPTLGQLGSNALAY